MSNVLSCIKVFDATIQRSCHARKLALIAAVFTISIWPASAQNLDHLKDARQRYEDCVWGASVNDWLFKREFDMAVEQAFQACATEEQFVSALALQHADPSTVAPLIAAMKSSLKQQVVHKYRAAAAKPQK